MINDSESSYSIVDKDRLRLLGKCKKQVIGNVQADVFWKKCLEDGTLQALAKYSTSPDKEYIGIADGSSYDGESYLYYIVTPYEYETVPDGYMIKEIPAHIWMKFRCINFGEGMSTANEEIYRKIYSEIIPTTEYEPAEYQLEVYPWGDGNYADNLSEIWIAVRKKENI